VLGDMQLGDMELGDMELGHGGHLAITRTSN